MSIAALDSPVTSLPFHQRISKRTRWLVVVSILVISALAWMVFANRRAIEVSTLVVESGLIEETVVNTRAGTVRSRQRARLSPEVGGRVLALPFLEGDAVHTGDIVLQIDPTSQQRRLALSTDEEGFAKAQAKQACLAATQAKREHERMAHLAADRIVSEETLERSELGLEQHRAACEASRARLAEARSAVAVSQWALEQTSLRSPFDGVVAEISVEIGEWTTPSPPALPVPPVIDIINLTKLYIAAPIDEVDAGRLAIGQVARVVVDSHRNRTLAGKVIRIAPYVLDLEAQNRTVGIEVELDPLPPDQQITLLPGTSADVEILVRKSQGLRVPATALYAEDSILRINEDGVLTQQKVELGLRNWRWVEVRSGLENGQTIVAASDEGELRPGTRAKAKQLQ